PGNCPCLHHLLQLRSNLGSNHPDISGKFRQSSSPSGSHSSASHNHRQLSLQIHIEWKKSFILHTTSPVRPHIPGKHPVPARPSAQLSFYSPLCRQPCQSPQSAFPDPSVPSAWLLRFFRSEDSGH